VASAPTYERGQAFFSLSSESSVEDAIGSQSIERFNGTYWDKIHITTTLSVRSGDIILIRAVGIGLCLGLEEQVASLSLPQSANNTSSSSMLRFVSSMYSSSPFIHPYYIVDLVSTRLKERERGGERI
jgi:hypothetical protein